ncbi:spermidine/putrescine ABC transporter substrate-binding protein [Spongisporangium articulatum]|uniref:Spermidine/putrescine ABC transporter substrate-binding protein n=1 Tax=Spongisporangium articulatum TaxID=3362603 RepID=A0ABW8ANY4_9ACTN
MPAPDRRAFLKALGVLGLGAAGLPLAACGNGADSPGSGPSPARDVSTRDLLVNWASRPLYLDYDADQKSHPTLDVFTRTVGIKVTYEESIQDGESFYEEVQPQLRSGRDIGADLVVLRDHVAARLIRQGYVQRLDRSKIPNAANLLPALADPNWDPGRQYSLPWQSGYTGLAWRRDAVDDGLRSVSDLWRKDLKGKVVVLSEMRDTMGLLLGEQGADVGGANGTGFTDDDFSKALEVLEKQLSSGQIRRVAGAEYADDLVSGDAVAVIARSGDIAQLNEMHGHKWDFALPDGGGLRWSDDLLIPIGAPHKENAEILINYYYGPKVAATVAEAIRFVCPVTGAQEQMQTIDSRVAVDDRVFPTPEQFAKVPAFRDLQPAEEAQFDSDFRTVIGV